MPATNFYSGYPLHRAHSRRAETGWLQAIQSGRDVRVLALWRNRHHVQDEVTPQPLWQQGALAREIVKSADDTVFLGERDAVPHYACDISAANDPLADILAGTGGVFADLRSLAPLVTRDDGAIMAAARGLLYWHRRARWCGKCGSPTSSIDAGHARVCDRPTCGERWFPRVDPAVIMLVTHKDRCLLGRQATWPPGMHSTLAGFVEIGESMEETVIREVAEEAGLRVVGRPEYRHSQPWPFPSSLMLGFRAETADDQLQIDKDELEQASWFTRAELRASPENETFRLPGKVSIARRLVEEWISEA